MGIELVPIEKMPKILVSGYWIYLHSPSDNAFKVLKVDFTKLKPEKFYEMVDELGKVLGGIDMEFRERRKEEGSRKIVAEFIEAYQKRRTLPQVSPYPQRFINIVNYIRTRLYDELNRRAIVIQSISSGRFKRNLYLLPRSEYDAFMNEIDKLNSELAELRKMIEQYHQGRYFKAILEVLDKYNVSYTYRKADIRDIIVETAPAIVDPEILKPYISRRAYMEIQKFKEKLVREAIEKFRKELDEVMEQYRAQILRKKFDPNQAKQQLQKLKEKIESMGIVSISPIIDPLIEMADKPEKLVGEGYVTATGKIKDLVESLT